MNRHEVLEQYDVNSHGVITTPGKFEDQLVYVPYFWEMYLDGGADEDDGEILTFTVTAADVTEFPELRDVKVVRMYETDQGFVISDEGVEA